MNWSSIRRRYRTALWVFVALCLLPGTWFLAGTNAIAQAAGRKLKSSVPPEYPELARKNVVRGVVRVQVIVSPEGKVKEVKEIGGNPVLLEALVKAVKQWKYEPAEKDSIVDIRFEFAP